jgi:predicted O-methyltransferase YrrM
MKSGSEGSAPKRDWQKAQDAIDTLVRLQIARGLAPLFMERVRPYEDNAQLAAMIEDRLLHRAAFIQKPPFLLKFYKRLLFAMEEAPQSILEIGVKGGGSTALWKALFPSATVVGLDIDLQHWLTENRSPDEVIYVQGDQTDVVKLGEIVKQYGPFSIVIDDASHIGEEQAITMRCLLPHVRSGGFYVVEDIHACLKRRHAEHAEEDQWAEFVATLFDLRRKRPSATQTPGARLAVELAPMIDDLIIASTVVAVRAH